MRRGFRVLFLLAAVWSGGAVAQSTPKADCIASGGDQRVSIMRGSKRDMEAVPGDDCQERSPR